MGNYEDNASIVVGNRMVQGGGGCYFIEFTKSYFYNTVFLWNYASLLGGAIGLTQQCSSYLQNVTFIDCSSDKGGVLSVSEESFFFIINCTFENNFATIGTILHASENYKSITTIVSSYIFNNSGVENLFNLMDSNLIINNSIFDKNNNILFVSTRTNLILNSIYISNHVCYNSAFGCAINAQNSSIKAKDAKIFEIHNYFQEGIVYFEESFVEFIKIDFHLLNNIKHKGSCFDLKNSHLFLDEANFHIYDSNCIYAINSSIYLNNTLFDNENFERLNQDVFLYGSIHCDSCLNFSIFNSVFQKNTLSENGGGVTLISENGIKLNALLSNVSFFSNEVFASGGGVSLQNVNAKIIDCYFFENKALKGAAIFFYSSCN